MIGSLRGTVLDRMTGPTAGELLLEVGGVGYRLSVPTGTLALAELTGPMFVHVHTHVRDDAIILYGFAAREERSCFETLIGTHGVGPAVALALLSVHSPTGLRRAVASDDVDALMLVPGIGKKTATRLLIELKARLDLDDEWEPDLSVVGSNGNTTNGPNAAKSEVRAALAGLGYGGDEVRDAMRGLPEEGSAEDLLRTALRQLAVTR
jgi:Holliday junction DNA helicase RuvA